MKGEGIRLCDEKDLPAIHTVINDGARAYQGVIPSDRLTDPYMSEAELRHEVATGVRFWAFERDGVIEAVMGIQPVQDVTLIRHAYVRSGMQGRGLGSKLLAHLRTLATGPVLIGTWAAATWAIRFYARHGFRMVSASEKTRLLHTYWNVPERQVETSVVLTDQPL